jgi:hypothetical protein
MASLWAANRLTSRQPRRVNAGRGVARFFQGTLIGLAVFTAIVTAIDIRGSKVPPPKSAAQNLRLLGLVISPLIGGTAVLLLDRRRNPQGPADPA